MSSGRVSAPQKDIRSATRCRLATFSEVGYAPTVTRMASTWWLRSALTLTETYPAGHPGPLNDVADYLMFLPWSL